jgi:hypothetical protein
MTHPNKAKGSTFERQVREYIRDQGLSVDHLRLAGTDDQGDLYVRESDSVLELKAEKRINLSGYLKEANNEADNYAEAHRRGADRPAFYAVVKARGKSVGQAYVVTTLDEWIRLNRKAK